MYEQHPYWCTGYTFWELHGEAPDLFLHLSRSDLVFFKGDLNHRKLTYDCAAPASTPFDIAIGPMASAAGAPKVCSLRTIKSDVVVGLESDETAERLDKEEPGWKISGKYVSSLIFIVLFDGIHRRFLGCRPSFRGSARGEGSVCVEINILFPALFHWTITTAFHQKTQSLFLFLVIVSCIQTCTCSITTSLQRYSICPQFIPCIAIPAIGVSAFNMSNPCVIWSCTSNSIYLCRPHWRYFGATNVRTHVHNQRHRR